MKTCLGSLLLIPIIIALIVTAVYHTSVNAELRFEPRDTNAQYINTQRSYRPQIPPPAAPKAAEEAPPNARLRDDDTAEEVK